MKIQKQILTLSRQKLSFKKFYFLVSLSTLLFSFGCAKQGSGNLDWNGLDSSCAAADSRTCSPAISGGWSGATPANTLSQAIQTLGGGTTSVSNPPPNVARLLDAAGLNLSQFDSNRNGILGIDEYSALLAALSAPGILEKIAEAMRTPILIASAVANNNSVVHIFNGRNGSLINTVPIFPGFAGNANLTMGDLDNDGIADIIAGAGRGGGPRVRVLSGKSGKELANFFAYESDFRGGVTVAVGDMDGDGQNDIITGAGPGGGPRVIVWSGKDLHKIADFMAFDSGFRGGVTVAAGDLNGDLKNELIIGEGDGGQGRVNVYYAGNISSSPTVLTPFDSGYTGAVNLAIGDLDQDNISDLVASPGNGGGPRIIGLKGTNLGTHLADFFAFNQANRFPIYIALGRFQKNLHKFNIIASMAADNTPVTPINIFEWNSSSILRSLQIEQGGPVAAGDWYRF